MKKTICCLFLCISFFSLLFGETKEAVPYSKDEFPPWVLDARRTEIITLGSLPFVTLLTTLGYSCYRYVDHDFSLAYLPNPFAKTSDSANLDTDEQLLIMGASALFCVGLGLTDLCYNIIRRNSIRKNSSAIAGSNAIQVVPSDDKDMTPAPSGRDRRSSYLYGGMKSAVF